jgi:hypothetical protein
VKLFRSNRGRIAIAALLLILILFRPGLHRLRNRIAGSIGAALGRRVELQNVRLRLLPRPGFELDGLIIYDDPSFSAEPMVRADEVSAPLRLTSLLRGRLEIATLSATEPSINLVRDSQGRWNLSALLERSAQIPAAPTAKRVSEMRPAFPYLEATHARINFKIGQEKTPYALSDADVALWQQSDNAWGARLQARPVRTEFNLTDTGLLRVDATWQRAAHLSETPLRATISWHKGQLGQISKLFSARDRGWRGGVTLNLNLSGTPQALLMRSQIVVDDFRRYDIAGANVRLSTECSANYNAAEREFKDLSCESPIGEGFARLRGSIAPFGRDFPYDLTLSAEKVPLAPVLRVVHESKQSLPADLAASGNLNGEFHARRNRGQSPQVEGEGSFSDARITSNSEKNEIVFGDVPLNLVNAIKPDAKAADENSVPGEPSLRLGPFPLATRALSPQAPKNVAAEPTAAAPTATGLISRSGYYFSLRGDTTLKNAFRLAKTLGIPSNHPAAQGSAHLDVSISGKWQGFPAPKIVGDAELKNVRLEVRGFNQPVQINTALLTLTPEAITLQRLSAQTGSTHWNGSVSRVRHCPSPACPFQFNLAADQLSASELGEWFTSHPTKRQWYRLLSSSENNAGPSPLMTMQARGNLRLARLALQRMTATQFSAQMEFDQGKLTLHGLSAQFLQGTHKGRWTIDFSHTPPRYEASGSLQNVSLPQLSALMNHAWATGTADTRFELTASGSRLPDLLNHVDGRLQFTVRNGSFPHLDFPGAPKPFPIHKFTGDLRLTAGQWTLAAGKLQSRDGIYQVSGTASSATGLDLVLTRGDDLSWNVTGTLADPHVVPATRTEAKTALKP